jgi:hypothetical protein
MARAKRQRRQTIRGASLDDDATRLLERLNDLDQRDQEEATTRPLTPEPGDEREQEPRVPDDAA